MELRWSDFAMQSLEEILIWYELQAGRSVAESIEERIFQQVNTVKIFPKSIPVSDVFPELRKLSIKNLPYVAFTRQTGTDTWEVVDIVHTSRKLPKIHSG
jgi:plasmid stabilization system protein ParE